MKCGFEQGSKSEVGLQVRFPFSRSTSDRGSDTACSSEGRTAASSFVRLVWRKVVGMVADCM